MFRYLYALSAFFDADMLQTAIIYWRPRAAKSGAMPY